MKYSIKLQTQRGSLRHIIFFTWKQYGWLRGEDTNSVQPGIICKLPGRKYFNSSLVVRCQCAVIFGIKSRELKCKHFLKQRDSAQSSSCKFSCESFPKRGTLNLKMSQVLPTVKGKRLETQLVSFCFHLSSSQMHAEFCLNPLNLYLVFWWLNFIFSATNCGIKKLLQLY